MFDKLILKLLFKMLKDYNLFFLTSEKCFFINRVDIDLRDKEVLLRSFEDGVNYESE